MRRIDVCLSPDMIHLYEVPNHSVVVVDILRATSCMVTAFAHGVQSIAPFAKLEDCLAMKSKGYLAAGERDGKAYSTARRPRGSANSARARSPGAASKTL